MEKAYDIEKILIEDDNLVILINEETISIPFSEVSEKLAKASATERKYFVLSPSGYGIHWPLLDEDISISGLLEAIHLSES
jgi:hypothetical protein